MIAGSSETRISSSKYGVYDCDLTRPSYSRFGGGNLPLASARMEWFWRNYCPAPDTRRQPLASPLRADLKGLPPVYLVIADHDILYDENIAMNLHLRRAGNKVTDVVYRGTTHAFVEAISHAEPSRTAIAQASAWLNKVERL